MLFILASIDEVGKYNNDYCSINKTYFQYWVFDKYFKIILGDGF